jgi:hypothetical protein
MRATESNHELTDHDVTRTSFGMNRSKAERKFSNQASGSNLLELELHVFESALSVEEVNLIVPSDPQSGPGKVSTSQSVRTSKCMTISISSTSTREFVQFPWDLENGHNRRFEHLMGLLPSMLD